jgi:hypothetical protein
MIERIASGGQTGADRGALDAAIALGVPHGGWCPAGRRAEDGPIPSRYELLETAEWEYPPRTRLNILHSEGTVIFTTGEPTGGSRLTVKLCEEHVKPFLHVDLGLHDENEAVDQICDWIDAYDIHNINVAGSRESSVPGIQKLVEQIIIRVVNEFGGTT